MEPRLLIITDPVSDHQPIKEASFVNVPTIAFCSSDAPLAHVDIAIPCNNKSKNSVALLYWLLAREVLRLRAQVVRSEAWPVAPDLFVYRDPEEAEKEAKSQETDGGDGGDETAPEGKIAEWERAGDAAAGTGADTTYASTATTAEVAHTTHTHTHAAHVGGTWRQPPVAGWTTAT